MFIVLITCLVNASSHRKGVSLNNQQCMIQTTFIHIHPYEYTQEICYYLFAVNLDRCVENCNTQNDLYNKIFVSNDTDDLNLSIFNLFTGIN